MILILVLALLACHLGYLKSLIPAHMQEHNLMQMEEQGVCSAISPSFFIANLHTHPLLLKGVSNLVHCHVRSTLQPVPRLYTVWLLPKETCFAASPLQKNVSSIFEPPPFFKAHCSFSMSIEQCRVVSIRPLNVSHENVAVYLNAGPSLLQCEAEHTVTKSDVHMESDIIFTPILPSLFTIFSILPHLANNATPHACMVRLSSTAASGCTATNWPCCHASLHQSVQVREASTTSLLPFCFFSLKKKKSTFLLTSCVSCVHRHSVVRLRALRRCPGTLAVR